MIEEVIKDYKKELAKSEYNLWYYRREFEHPVKMGREEAKAGVELWERHIKSVEEQIISLEEYAKVSRGN